MALRACICLLICTSHGRPRIDHLGRQRLSTSPVPLSRNTPSAFSCDAHLPPFLGCRFSIKRRARTRDSESNRRRRLARRVQGPKILSVGSKATPKQSDPRSRPTAANERRRKKKTNGPPDPDRRLFLQDWAPLRRSTYAVVLHCKSLSARLVQHCALPDQCLHPFIRRAKPDLPVADETTPPWHNPTRRPSPSHDSRPASTRNNANHALYPRPL
jgi:hypothetical protein